jgi:hypothetical protein
VTPRKLCVWDVYFAGIVSIRFHPKNVESMHSLDAEFSQRIISKCAEIADLMMVERSRRDSESYVACSDGS